MILQILLLIYNSKIHTYNFELIIVLISLSNFKSKIIPIPKYYFMCKSKST